MAEVNLTVDGRIYGIACDDGQEARVQQLGKFLDQRIKEVSHGSGANNKSQNMILASLTLADELFDLRENLAKVTNNNEQLKRQISIAAAPQSAPVYQGLAPQDEREITATISKLANKVEALAKRVQKA